jgi:RNA recognition motif-containing protein
MFLRSFFMPKKLYVGNMSYETTQETLTELFGQYGNISEVKVITDHQTGRSKGFGFVTFEDAASGEEAMNALDGQEFEGRTLKVNEALQKTAPRGNHHNNRRQRY